MLYGRNGFKKDRGGTAYHIEVDITGGAYDIEAGVWDDRTVPAASCPGYADCIDDGRRWKGVVNMWKVQSPADMFKTGD